MSTRKTAAKAPAKGAAKKAAQSIPQAAPLGGAAPFADDRLQLLIEENRRLADELQAAQKLAAALEKTNQQSIAARDKAVKESEALKETNTGLTKQVSELTTANKRMTTEISRLSRQVERTPLNPLTAEEAASLIDRFIGGIRTTKTLELRDVDLTLKVATGKFGDQPVLLLAEPGAVRPEALHEIRFSLKGTTAAEALAGGVLDPNVRPR